MRIYFDNIRVIKKLTLYICREIIIKFYYKFTIDKTKIEIFC